MNFVERVLVEHRDRFGLAAVGLGGELETTLLTPRFPTSRHVVALVHARGRSVPGAVVKMPRQPTDTSGIDREAEVLRQLRDLTGSGRLRVPAVLGTVACDGQTLLVESVVAGPALDRRRVQRDFGAALAAGRSFIAALPQTRPAAENEDWYPVAVERPLARLAQVVPLAGEAVDLCARTHALLEPLRSVALPAVFEHGDLAHPNLFLDAGGTSLGVIDWERATIHGMPGHDLVFFVQFLSECLVSASTVQTKLGAFDAAFLGPGAWATSVLREHLRVRDVDPTLWGPVVVASWARTAASIAERLAAGELGGASLATEAVHAAVGMERDILLWRHALEAAERGDLEDR